MTLRFFADSISFRISIRSILSYRLMLLLETSMILLIHFSIRISWNFNRLHKISRRVTLKILLTFLFMNTMRVYRHTFKHTSDSIFSCCYFLYGRSNKFFFYFSRITPKSFSEISLADCFENIISATEALLKDFASEFYPLDLINDLKRGFWTLLIYCVVAALNSALARWGWIGRLAMGIFIFLYWKLLCQEFVYVFIKLFLIKNSASSASKCLMILFRISIFLESIEHRSSGKAIFKSYFRIFSLIFHSSE